MRASVSFRLKGDDKVIKALEQAKEKGRQIGQEAIAEASLKMVQEAKKRAPKNEGELAGSIIAETLSNDGLSARVVVLAEHGPYMEFGTGPQVSIPPEFEKMAAQFRGGQGGSFKEGLERIKSWCRKKGIEESAAYPIFMSILRKGLRPRPFFYPAFIYGRTLFYRHLEEGLKKLKL